MTSTLFTPEVHELFARVYQRPTLVHLRDVAAAQDHEYHTRGGGITHGWMCQEIALGCGLPGDLAWRSGAVLDALQPAIDLADNLADEELDRALGRAPERRYRRTPRESRFFVPALILGACIAEVHRAFPAAEGWQANDASARLLGVLSRMNVAQGLPLGHPRRNAGLSGEVGRLWLLPFWLLPLAHPGRSLLPSLDRWAYAFAATIQLGWDVVENPGDGAARDRLEAARRRARRAWPKVPAFAAGGALSVRELLTWPT